MKIIINIILNNKHMYREAVLIFYNVTRMTTFIKAKLEKSDDQTNIDKYKEAANITEYHII